MRILLIHQNFPGQFRHMAEAWAARPGWEVIALGRDTAPGLRSLHHSTPFNLRFIPYTLHRAPQTKQHPYLRKMEDAVLHGQAVARVLLQLKARGWHPDVILAHPGWGETLYAKDVFADVRLVHFCEWFYSSKGADMGFDPEFPVSFDDEARIRSWNALHLLNLENCDAAVSPTQWQRSRHPLVYQPKIAVVHEGIATEQLGPKLQATLRISDQLTLKAGDPVITFVARHLEPYRGFHSFMRALELIQMDHKTCHAVIVGGDGVSYGRRPTDAPNWREQMLRECRGIDLSRTHFLGQVPYERYKAVLQVSAAHVYLTYPFVLSWSMLEAMASGCLVIGSDTAPVAEVLIDGVNGRLVAFRKPPEIAERVLEAILHPELHQEMRFTAQQDITQQYSRRVGQEAYEGLLGSQFLSRC